MARQHPSITVFPYTTLFRSSLEEVKDLNAILEMNGKESVYFINVDGISTRDSFKLEQPLKRQGLTYRLVSGGFENRSEEHTSELQSRENLVCRLLLEKKNKI